MILLAAESMSELSIKDLSIDINVPSMADTICKELLVPAEMSKQLLAAINRKDAASITEIASDASELLAGLLGAAGPAVSGMSRMDAMDLPGEAALLNQRLSEVANLVREEAPDLTVTIDPADSRGFEYHTGISFALFARSARSELGTGGRYLAGGDEPATGFTLFTDIIMDAIVHPSPAQRIYVPFGVAAENRKRLQELGWVTVNGLIPEDNPTVEAERLECSHVWLDSQIRELT